MNVKVAIAGGLYLIRLSDSHYYGGRTANFAGRWQKHLRQLKKGVHPNAHMQAVFNQFGHFEPEVIAAADGESAKVLEQNWLDAHVGQPGCVNLSSSAAGPFAAGSRFSDLHRQRMSESRKRRSPISEETRARMSASQRAKAPASEETRQKMSAVRKGKIPTDAQRAALSHARELARGKELSASTRERLSAAHKGRKASEETKRKMSESQKSRFAKEAAHA